MGEVKRLFNLRFCAVLLVILFINALLLLRDNVPQKGVSQIYNECVKKVQESKGEDMSYQEAARAAYMQYLKEHDISAKKQNVTDDVKNTKKFLFDNAAYVDEYKDMVQKKIDNASKIISYKMYKKDSFENINLLKTRHDLAAVKDADVTLGNGIWLESLYRYSYIQIFSIILMAVTVYSFFNERSTGIYYIIHAGKNGRVQMYFKRLLIVAAESFAVNLLLYIESICILLNIHGGIEGINEAASNDEAFFMIGGTFTRLECALMLLLLSTLATVVLSVLLWFVLSLFSNINIGMCIYVIMCAVSILVWAMISTKSPLRFAHYINLYYMFFPHRIFTYVNWGYSFGVITVIESAVIFAAILLTVCAAANLFVNVKCYFTGKANWVEKIFGYFMSKFMLIIEKSPEIIKEMYKILISQKAVIILAVLMFFVVKIDVGSGYNYSIEDSYLAGYYDKAHNMTYSYELELIYKDYEAEYEELLSTIDLNDSLDATKAANRKRLISLIRDNIDYVKELNENGVNAVVLKPFEYKALFGDEQEDNQKMLALINVFGAIVIAAGFLSYERKCNINNMVMSYKDRKRWIIKKIFANSILLGAFVLVSYGVYYYRLIAVCKPASLTAPVKSIPMLGNYPVNLPVIGVIAADIFIKYILLFCLSGIICLISKRIKYLYCVLAGMVVTLPQLFSIMGFAINDKLIIGRYIAYFPYLLNEKTELSLCYIVFVIIFICGNIAYADIVRKVSDAGSRKIPV